MNQIELDLLRRGPRPFNHPRLPPVPYLISLTRSNAGVVDLWPVELQQPLPIIPVPLREPDDDMVLDLGRALNEIYDEAAYDLSIDYDQPPLPPAVSGTEAAWMQALLSNLKSGIG